VAPDLLIVPASVRTVSVLAGGIGPSRHASSTGVVDPIV
jgi:hypothetical protein